MYNSKTKANRPTKLIQSHAEPPSSFFTQKYRLLVFLLAIITFANTLRAGFIWDDRAAIQLNPDVKEGPDLFLHDFWGVNMSSPFSHKSYRPLTVLSFRLDYIIYGLKASGYHLTNVILHAINCMLVIMCAERLLLSQYSTAISSFLFAVHPVHCDAVASIVGRADILCTMFCLSAFLTHNYSLRSHTAIQQATWFFFSLCCVTSGTFCKELGLSFAGILFVMELQAIWKGGNWKAGALKGTVLIAFTVIFLRLRLRLHGDHLFYKWTILENSLSLLPWGKTRILTTAYTHAIYLFKLVWPQSLSYDYGFESMPKIVSCMDPRNMLTLLAYGTTFTILIMGLRKPSSPLPIICSFGILPFVPAANVLFPVGAEVAERLMYLPSVGFCFAVGFLGGQIINGRKHITTAIVVVVLSFMLKTILRNEEWLTERRLFESSLRVFPTNVKTLNNLGREFLDLKQAEKAAALLHEAIRIHPQYATAHLNLGLTFHLLKKPLQAFQHYQIALQLDPSSASTQGHLGQDLLLYYQRSIVTKSAESIASADDILDQAQYYLDAALAAGEIQPSFLHNRGVVDSYRKNYHSAIRYYEAAAVQNEQVISSGYDTGRAIDSATLYNMLGLAYQGVGNSNKTVEVFGRGIELNPMSLELYNNLAVHYNRVGKFGDALKLFEKAMSIDPYNGITATNAGYAAEKLGNSALAFHLYQRAFELNREHPQIRANFENFQGKGVGG